MRKLYILAAMAAVMASPAYAVTLKKDMPVCITEDLMSQFFKALASKDMDAFQYLLDNGCRISDKALKVTVLDTSNFGTLAHIRAYRGKNAVEVYTPIEALDGYDPLHP